MMFQYRRVHQTEFILVFFVDLIGLVAFYTNTRHVSSQIDYHYIIAYVLKVLPHTFFLYPHIRLWRSSALSIILRLVQHVYDLFFFGFYKEYYTE
jgi:hypothetical protein